MHSTHRFIQRETCQVMNEELLADSAIRFIYSTVREKAPWLFTALTGHTISKLLGFVNYDLALNARFSGSTRLIQKLGINIEECLLPIEEMDTPRKIFERRIAYWHSRPMDEAAGVIVSPADSRMLAGSLDECSTLFLKGKFFDYQELLSWEQHCLHAQLQGGDYAIFRLTPEKYHFTHAPVSGVVTGIYEVDGRYHSCNPSSAIALATPLSKNRRVVTVIDTEVKGGSGVGTVVMIEIVALMIGDIVQCYSEERYRDPVQIYPGLFLKKGQPKALFRPGSSTVALFFEKNRIAFSRDLLGNQHRHDVKNRFSAWLEQPAIETELKVRSTIGRKNTP
jgi:phosphatidylserine decarboxylase